MKLGTKLWFEKWLTFIKLLIFFLCCRLSDLFYIFLSLSFCIIGGCLPILISMLVSFLIALL